MIGVAGPEAFLAICPLELEPQLDQGDFPRAWLLPLLKAGIRGASLAYYHREFMPLASSLLAAHDAAAMEGHDVMAKAYSTLYLQVTAAQHVQRDPQAHRTSTAMDARHNEGAHTGCVCVVGVRQGDVEGREGCSMRKLSVHSRFPLFVCRLAGVGPPAVRL